MKHIINFLLLLPVLAFSQEAVLEGESVDLTAEQKEYLAWAVEFEGKLERQKGDIQLSAGKVNLSIPEGFYFLDAEDTQSVLEEAWGNPPAIDPVLGMIFPDEYSPLDQSSWGVTIEYLAEGHVKDKDAEKLDYDDLLKEMKADTKLGSDARVEAGYETIELVGWASAPYYDHETKKLHWAKELKFGNDELHTLNYNIRVLGRDGVLLMNFIAGMDKLPEIQQSITPVLAMAEFTEGNTYADFDPKLDKVAAYGIGGLVAGKLIAKTGLIAKILLVTKKFWIIGLAVLGGGFKKFFSKNKEG